MMYIRVNQLYETGGRGPRLYGQGDETGGHGPKLYGRRR